MSVLSEEVSERLKEVTRQIPVLEKALQASPEGKLRVSTSRKNMRFYWVTGSGHSSGHYIRRAEEQLVKRLAQKDYDRKALKFLKQEQRLLMKLERYYKKGANKKKRTSPQEHGLEEFFSGPEELLWRQENEARQPMIKPMVLDTEAFVQEWLSETFEKKAFRDTDTEYYTRSGIRVRSKTELIIAEMLENKGIPFYYEKPLQLKGRGFVHPDFTVLNKKRRKTLYWEHMGMMDDEYYRDHALEKINYYILSGFFPGKELLLTHETATRPIRTGILESIIDQYLLH